MDAGVDSGSPDASVDPLAPIVTITAPAPASDPNQDEVITSTKVMVQCRVEASMAMGAVGVDKSAVKIAMLNPMDSSKTITGSVDAISDVEYQAMFDVSTAPNGPLTFQCSGRDLATTPHTGMAMLSTLLDLGPTIDLHKPLDMHTYALNTPLAIEFQVNKAPIADGDNEADVDQVMLTVSGMQIPVTESTMMPGLYQTSIDFSDTTKFLVPPSSAQLTIDVTDKRTPSAPTREAKADITLDGKGPTIMVTSPPNGAIRQGNVPLVLTVTDPSGIMPGSVIASINGKQYTNWTVTGSTYSQTFATRDLDGNRTFTQLTIDLTATDSVGNQTIPPVSHQIKLDNLPPLISLDPPSISESHVSNNMTYCSVLFDPVGELAANDGQTVLASWHYRALVEDQTNMSPGATVSYIAGTDPASVVLYLQPSTSTPLLIDADHDANHLCDTINYDGLSTDKQPHKISLAAVNPAGGSWFAKTMTATRTGLCSFDPNGSDTMPGTVCLNSEMMRVVPARVQGKPPAVYAYMPSNDANNGECNGQSWEISSFVNDNPVHEGWLCLAASATDTVGNIGVSAPLRVCYDDNNLNNGTPCTSPGTPPTCTDGCTISAAQQFTQEIWPVQ